MKIIKTSEALPKSGRYVLAWLEGAKIPMRAMWADQHTLPLGDDADPEWGEYSEEKDEYFCPAGWYEMNQHEEQHWGVSGNVVAWCELPRLDHQCLAQIEEPAGAAPVAVAGPAREEIALLRAEHGITSSGRGIKEFEQVDAFVRAVLQRWGAAPALEAPAAPAVPMKATPEMRAAFRSAFREGGFWDDRLDYALDQMLAAAPQAPAALADPLCWVFEDELPKSMTTGAYNALYPHSRVDMVRMFPIFGPAAPAAPAVDASDDKALLDFLRTSSCDLRSIDVPTGGDDSDVHWRVIEHYMSEPREREIGRSWSDDPREAIRAAIAAQAKEGGAAA